MEILNSETLNLVNGGKDIWYYITPNDGEVKKAYELTKDAYKFYQEQKKIGEERIQKAGGAYGDPEPELAKILNGPNLLGID